MRWIQWIWSKSHSSFFLKKINLCVFNDVDLMKTIWFIKIINRLDCNGINKWQAKQQQQQQKQSISKSLINLIYSKMFDHNRVRRACSVMQRFYSKYSSFEKVRFCYNQVQCSAVQCSAKQTIILRVRERIVRKRRKKLNEIENDIFIHCM